MLPDFAQLQSTVPSALNALGIGTIIQLPAAIVISILGYPDVLTGFRSQVRDFSLPSPTIEYAAPFALFFYLYVLGVAAIALSQRMRQNVFRDDPVRRLAKVLRSNDRDHLKLYTEQSVLAQAMDGFAFFAFGMAISCLLVANVAYWFFFLMSLFSLILVWVFWREAQKRLQFVDEVVAASFLETSE